MFLTRSTLTRRESSEYLKTSLPRERGASLGRNCIDDLKEAGQSHAVELGTGSVRVRYDLLLLHEEFDAVPESVAAVRIEPEELLGGVLAHREEEGNPSKQQSVSLFDADAVSFSRDDQTGRIIGSFHDRHRSRFSEWPEEIGIVLDPLLPADRVDQRPAICKTEEKPSEAGGCQGNCADEDGNEQEDDHPKGRVLVDARAHLEQYNHTEGSFMMKAAISVTLFVFASLAISLASAPKPMACDAWSCGGQTCSPAKYAAVRNVPILPPSLASPFHAAGFLAMFLVATGVTGGLVLTVRRRSGAEPEASAKPVSQSPLLVALLAAGMLLAAPAGKAGEKEGDHAEQVLCVLCGDYTFDASLGTEAVYKGKKIQLCSVNELKELRKNPDKYVWATDVVTGKKVHKLETVHTVDRRVKVRKVKYDNKIEVWPRRFFFESAESRDAFLKNPEKYLREPYDVE